MKTLSSPVKELEKKRKGLQSLLESDPNDDPTLTMQILRLQDGADAFAFIVQKFQPVIRAICYQYFPNDQEAEDAYQEALIKLWKNIGKFDPTMKFLPWLRTVVNQVCIDRFRFLKIRRPLNEEFSDALARTVMASNDRTEINVELAYMRNVMEAFLLELEGGSREEQNLALTLKMRVLEGLTNREIAVQLNVHVDTVSDRYNAAIRKFNKWRGVNT